MENEELLPKPQTDLPLPRPPATEAAGNVGALINTYDTYFTGFAIDMKLSEEYNEELFDQILSTFKFTDSSADTSSTTANGVTITIFPNHGPVGTKVNLKITGVKDFSNLTLFFKDSANGVPENGMGIAIRDINPVTGGFSGTYPIPSIVSSYHPNSQSPGPDVPTTKGVGSLRLTHGNDSQTYVTIPFKVE